MTITQQYPRTINVPVVVSTSNTVSFFKTGDSYTGSMFASDSPGIEGAAFVTLVMETGRRLQFIINGPAITDTEEPLDILKWEYRNMNPSCPVNKLVIFND